MVRILTGASSRFVKRRLALLALLAPLVAAAAAVVAFAVAIAHVAVAAAAFAAEIVVVAAAGIVAEIAVMAAIKTATSPNANDRFLSLPFFRGQVFFGGQRSRFAFTQARPC